MPQITQAPITGAPNNAIIKQLGAYTYHALGHHSQRDYLGFEIEVDTTNSDAYRNSDALACVNILKNGGLMSEAKSDASLRYGFELITHPATLDYLKAIEPALIKLWAYLTAKGYNNDTGNAGGHIHVARRTLGKTTETQQQNINRLIKWVYRNKAQFIQYCQRESRFARYNEQQEDNKFVAINTLHRNTIEFRIFSGLVSLHNMIANGELVTLIIKTLTNHGKRLEDYTLDTLITSNYRTHKAAYNYWLSVK